MLAPAWKKNDKKAYRLIIGFSLIVFLAISILSRYKLNVDLGFDVHIFAKINAVLNSAVTILLIAALIAVKTMQYKVHKRIMMVAMSLSILFLVSYICHHLFAGETLFGDVNHDGIVSEAEQAAVGNTRIIYWIILGTHIPLAGIILPFILFSAYRGMTGEWNKHKRLTRITWPIWLYVAITGVVVYLMISPYYYN
jgi:putative membrane protein